MKEFFELLKKIDLKGVFVNPTKNGFLQFFRYLFVGGIATIVDWGILFLLTDLAHIYHLVSAIIAFVAGLITNFFLSKLLVFKANEARVNAVMEFISYAIIGKRQINHRIALHPVNVRKYKQKQSVRL
jgi:putative flippase GtrA